MKGTLAILGLLLAVSVPSVAAQLDCQVSSSLEVISKKRLEIKPGDRVEYGTVGEKDIRVKNLGASFFEIEIYDKNIPSRNYVNGYLKARGDKLAWTLWTRDLLLEVSCSAAQQ